MMELTSPTPTRRRRSLTTTTTTTTTIIFLSSAYHHVVVFFMLLLLSFCVVNNNNNNNNRLIMVVDAFFVVRSTTTSTTRTTTTTLTTTKQQQQQQQQQLVERRSNNHHLKQGSCCIRFPPPHYAAKKKDTTDDDDDTVVTEESSSSSESSSTTTKDRGIIIQQQQHAIVGSSSRSSSRNSPRFEKRWNESYKKLIGYKKIHGHCDVPLLKLSSSKDYNDDTLILGRWVSLQRTYYKQGRMKKHRMDKLNDIGFNWKVKRGRGSSRGRSKTLSSYKYKSKSWDETYNNDLTEYYNMYGHTNVPQKVGNLGQWVKFQREKYHQGKLSQERIDKLNKLHFQWKMIRGSSYNDKLWLSKYDELKSYKNDRTNNINGDCNVPANTSSLGIWVQNQRAFYLKGKLRNDRKQLLDDIGFEFILRRR